MVVYNREEKKIDFVKTPSSKKLESSIMKGI